MVWLNQKTRHEPLHFKSKQLLDIYVLNVALGPHLKDNVECLLTSVNSTHCGRWNFTNSNSYVISWWKSVSAKFIYWQCSDLRSSCDAMVLITSFKISLQIKYLFLTYKSSLIVRTRCYYPSFHLNGSTSCIWFRHVQFHNLEMIWVWFVVPKGFPFRVLFVQ